MKRLKLLFLVLCAAVSLMVHGQGYKRISLVEQFTSLYCVNCPRGDSLLEEFCSRHADEIAWTSHRVGYRSDEFTIEQDEELVSFGVEGNPYAMFDRTKVKGSTVAFSLGTADLNSLESSFQTVNSVPAQVGLSVNCKVNEKRMKIDVVGECQPSASTSLKNARLHIYVVENNVTSKRPQTGSSPLRYVHDNVLRKVLTTNAGTSVTWSNNQFVYSDTIVKEEGWKNEDLRVIAFLTKPSDVLAATPTGEVLNAGVGKAVIGEIEGGDDSQQEDPLLAITPAAMSNYKVEAGARGALSVSVSGCAPTKYCSGSTITQSMTVIVLRGATRVKTLNNVKPGQEIAYKDSLRIRGAYTYGIYAQIDDICSDTLTSTVFVGHDAPASPAKIEATCTDGKATIHWCPSEGQNGGYVDPSLLRYTVVRARQLPGDIATRTEKIADGIADTLITDIPPVVEGGAYYYYRVYASNLQGSSNNYNRSNGIVLAETETLPYTESFSAGKLSTFWTEEHDVSSRWWPMQVANKFCYDQDEGLLGFTPYQADEWSRWLSGPISLGDAVNPVLTFYYFFADPQEDYFAVGISVDDAPFKLLQQFDITDASKAKKWQRVDIPLKDYVGSGHIQLSFDGVSSTTITVIYVDKLSILDITHHNIAVTNLKAPRQLKVGREDVFQLTLLNNGLEDVTEPYRVKVSLENRDLLWFDGPSLKTNEEKTVSFALTPDNRFDSNVEVIASLDYPQDEAAYDNVISTKVGVTLSSYPMPSNLVLTNGVLSWDTPESPRQDDGYVTDGFEDAPDFTIKDFGQWSMLDKDNRGTYFAVHFPNAGQPMSYVVMNPSQIEGIEDCEFDFSVHGGKKMLVAFASPTAASENWLISPELSGNAQDISFYARSIDKDYPESYSVRVAHRIDDEYQEVSNGTVDGNWNLVSVSLPKDARYFAIVNTSANGRAFAIDDVTFAPDTLASQPITLLGYNVYCDGVLLNNTPLTTTTYHPVQTGLYTVSAVYDLGESRECVCSQQTSMQGVDDKKLLRKALFDLQGRRLLAEPQSGLFIKDGRLIKK